MVGGGDVEVGEGLVEEEEFGVGLEDAGEGGALAHALGVLADGAGEVGVEADGAEGHLGGAYAGAALFAVEGGEVVEVLHGGELVVEHGGVAHVGHAAALLVGRSAEDGDGAAGGGDEAGDDAEEGGFAGAVFAEDDGAGAGGEGGGDVAESGEGAVELGDGVELAAAVELLRRGLGLRSASCVSSVSLHASIWLAPADWWQRVDRLEENEYFETDCLLFFLPGFLRDWASCATDASAGCGFAGAGAGYLQAADRDQYNGLGGEYDLAAEAMRKRLLDAGFPAEDVVVLGPNDRKGNMVARYRGKPGSTKKPVLIIGHIDVVEAKREDWTTDPFVFTEKDGYFYGRGTQDMKESDAAW